ncbi:hypothetical protein E2R68_06005 [Psychromonas sp. RZ22]|uniref:hypothetical protein n=1 Tax=Psychromonas algarum TaxID=2555643 RepID=UPI0010677428|nr:hypothetical protein [Psychromonas sp. RZ22]TEW55305.1 hypothetical protein E2R68_06005 [Psychromonas sp. RZ22]
MIVLDEIVKILTFYHGENNFNMNPLVPREIEHYARAVLDIPDDEYVLAAMRTSFTKFHRGIVIGRDGIYWQNDIKVETSVNFLTWRQMSEQKSSFRARRTTVELGNGAVFDNTGSLNKTSVMINILDLLIDKYEEQETDRDGFVFDGLDLSELMRSVPENKAELKAESAESAAAASTVSFFSIIVSLFNGSLFRKSETK